MVRHQAVVTPICVCVCRALLEPVERLLRMLLLWDPAERGGGLDPDTHQHVCYTALQNILEMKVDSHTHQIFEWSTKGLLTNITAE